MSEATLGQQANINLGGYIPAAPRQPKIWQQVLAQFLGNTLSEAGGAAVQHLTSPDLSKMDSTGAIPDNAWYKRNPTAGDIATVQGSRQGAEKVGIERSHVANETGHLANETKSTDAGIRQTDTKLEHDAGRLQLEAMTTGAQIEDMGAKVRQAQQTHELAKQHLAVAKDESERNHWLGVMKLQEDILNHGFDNHLKAQELGLRRGQYMDEASQTPAKIDELRARAEYERGLGRQTGAAKLTPEEMRAQLKAMLGN